MAEKLDEANSVAGKISTRSLIRYLDIYQNMRIIGYKDRKELKNMKHRKKKKLKKHKKIQGQLEGRMARHELYDEAGTNSKILINLRELCRMQRLLSVENSSQKRILMMLEDAGGTVKQRELTMKLRIKSGSASEIISKLEAAGYVQRSRNEEDRRAVDLTLTETGKEMAQEAIEEHKKKDDQNFAVLTDDEKNELLSLLEKVNADWSARCLEIEEDRWKARQERKRAHMDQGSFHDRPRRRRGHSGEGRGSGRGMGRGHGNGRGRRDGRFHEDESDRED